MISWRALCSGLQAKRLHEAWLRKGHRQISQNPHQQVCAPIRVGIKSTVQSKAVPGPPYPVPPQAPRTRQVRRPQPHTLQCLSHPRLQPAHAAAYGHPARMAYACTHMCMQAYVACTHGICIHARNSTHQWWHHPHVPYHGRASRMDLKR